MDDERPLSSSKPRDIHRSYAYTIAPSRLRNVGKPFTETSEMLCVMLQRLGSLVTLTCTPVIQNMYIDDRQREKTITFQEKSAANSRIVLSSVRQWHNFDAQPAQRLRESDDHADAVMVLLVSTWVYLSRSQTGHAMFVPTRWRIQIQRHGRRSQSDERFVRANNAGRGGGEQMHAWHGHY